MKKEKIHKVKVKYPKIREISKKLYSNAYESGRNPEDNDDSYDYSSAYKEIEKLFRQEILDMLERLDMEELKEGISIRTSTGEAIGRDRENVVDGHNSAVQILKDKIKKEKEDL